MIVNSVLSKGFSSCRFVGPKALKACTDCRTKSALPQYQLIIVPGTPLPMSNWAYESVVLFTSIVLTVVF